MTDDEIAYYRARALEEREMADNAKDGAIATAHRKMAELYGEIIEQRVLPPLRAAAE
jgi:hypothetical protein